MTAQIPNGYGYWTGTITIDGSSRPCQTTMGYLPQIGLTAAQQNAAIRTEMVKAGHYFNASNMTGEATFAESKVLYRNLGGLLIVDIDTTPVIGTKVGSMLAINSSILVRKRTAFAGKKYRGRFMIPPTYLIEGDVDMVGNIVSGTRASLDTLWDDTRADLVAAGIQPVLLHFDTTPPTVIDTFSVNGKIGTIGKRIR